MDESALQPVLDQEHLRLLRIGYFIQGGVTVFFSLFGLMYIFMGLLFAYVASQSSGNPSAPPKFMGIFFALFGSVFVLAGAVFAVLHFLAAQGIGRRRSRTLCLVAGGLSCILIPYGTALGICTFIVLSRPSVRALFSDGDAA